MRWKCTGNIVIFRLHIKLQVNGHSDNIQNYIQHDNKKVSIFFLYSTALDSHPYITTGKMSISFVRVLGA